MPFEVKDNMRLAPQHRREPIGQEDKLFLDELLNKQVYLYEIVPYSTAGFIE